MDDVRLKRFEAGDASWVVDVHAEIYARDEGFDMSFGTLVAGIVAEFVAAHDPARETGFLAMRGEDRLGSIFCVRGERPDEARLRLFLLVPEVRGTGLGRRLLGACLDFARDAGYRRIALRTHESHRAACALYARTGFVLTDQRPVTSFGMALCEQRWQRDL